MKIIFNPNNKKAKTKLEIKKKLILIKKTIVIIQ